jgi:hypothetical protein
MFIFRKYCKHNCIVQKENRDYFEYIDRINQSSWATKVKISDLRDNMDITRLKKSE